MNRRLALGIVTILSAALLAGCGAKKVADNNEGAAAGSGNSGNTAAGSENGVAGGNAAEEKTYQFASDASYAPMEFLDKDELKGFDIDFLAAVMKEAGLKYEIRNVAWDAMLESVKQGTEFQAGVSSISITPERGETYDFSMPYFESKNVIMVKEGSDITSGLDLKDKKVALQGGTTADILMTKIMGEGNTDLKKFDSNAVALLELGQGGADAVVADIAIVRDYIKNNPGKKYKEVMDDVNFNPEYYGLAYPKGSELKARLDPAIKAVIENGTYADIYKKWFDEAPDTTHLLETK
ncbi:basic amino acid ABC transporter substrate-binding protein [Paenibacillus sacheonensis]|uniref:Transporter substrate-binding domain-containing protein n=1 Tax=Paenibacillus sacheonensis TaxID=742054 RepID=A0A7X4YT71_9BACL|nr:basic amino acid ABC transporter substrate-binding protein [Paenibacillus sacheonensis]MBM7568418.1 polar amino acid transport system substrate-binding protein [Paenibacillus sacheonensis]NBC72116.1 transporter substrate-binding domain-containing protein [Paenibacillus sacheonensis]